VLGPEHPDTLTSMGNLASTYRDQVRWTEAERLDVQVIETSKTVLGPEHPFTLNSMANLASTFRNQARWTEAGELNMQVMETRKTILGPEHPDTLTQPGVYFLESGTMDRGGKARGASDGDIQNSTRA
jgi:Tetratricopeptide repeat